DEVPLLRSLRPEVPEPVEELIARMLAKAPSERPHDGDRLLAELEALRTVPLHEAPLVHALPELPPRWLTHEEHLVCVIMADRLVNTETPGTMDQVELSDDQMADRAALQHALSQLGAKTEWLPDNSLVAYLG